MIKDSFFKKTPRISLAGAYRFWRVKRRSYAASIVERIYDYFFRGANSLYFEYHKYYRKEFSDFGSFLENKYNLFPNEVRSMKSLLLYHKSLAFEADGHVTDLLEDQSIKSTFQKYIGVHSNDN